jgi:membrane protease YdiL (CAAX protease family)
LIDCEALFELMETADATVSLSFARARTMTRQGRPRGEPAAIAFAILFPSLITWIYFVLLRNAPAAIQQGAYGVGKFIQFTFPLLWVVFIVREPVFARQRRPISGFGPGIAFGLSVCVVAWALYLLGLRSWPGLDVARQMAQEKVSGMGIDSTWKYCLMGLFYSVLHSGMEEYYWRWFVFSRLTKLMGIPASIWISSLGFMAHHVIVLAFFFFLPDIAAGLSVLCRSRDWRSLLGMAV